MTGYWNPLPTARRVVEDVGEKAEELFTGVWEQRNRRNVPGPFYAAETDSLALGRREAPDHIAWGFNADPAYLPHYHDAARGHRDFVAPIDDGLEDYLRGYLFWLEQRREPRDGEALPLLRG
ncbi:hypothetical protein ACFZDF_08675 [Streptomyces sp. NPDC007910]|uniref:hypothetical protein n=1 Tax=Streptomyces sp. NPDC007910 TaxID=3364790 RepID=UPI0036E51617